MKDEEPIKMNPFLSMFEVAGFAAICGALLAYVVDGNWGPVIWIVFSIFWGMVGGAYLTLYEVRMELRERRKKKGGP